MRGRGGIDVEPGGSDLERQRMSLDPDRFTLRVAHFSDRGLKRTNNEDSVLVLRLIRDGGDGTADRRVLAVADGMGGMQRGEIASRLTITALSGYIAERFGEVPEGDVAGNLEFLRNALAAVNERVYASQDPRSPTKMGSTLVVAYIVGPSLYVAHAGDSRCYLLRDRQIKRATRDDSAVQRLIEAGEITEAQAFVDPRRSKITNGIGLHPPDRFQGTVQRLGEVVDLDYLLLCSDGLHGVLVDEEIARAIYGSTDAASAARDLLERATKAGAPDNISLVLARVVPGGPSGDMVIHLGGLWTRLRRGGRRITGSTLAVEGRLGRGQ